MDTLDFMGCLALGFSGSQEKHVELLELGSVHWAKNSKNMARKKQQNSPATSPKKGLTSLTQTIKNPQFKNISFFLHTFGYIGFSQKPTKKQQQTNLPFLFHFPVPGEINHPSAQVISSAKVLLLALRSEPKNRSVWPLPRLAAGAPASRWLKRCRDFVGGVKSTKTPLKGQEPTLSYISSSQNLM